MTSGNREIIRRPVIGGPADSYQTHELRKNITGRLSDCLSLRESQRADVGLVVGELLKNAFGHGTVGGFVEIHISDDCAGDVSKMEILIANPSDSDRPPEKPCLPDDPLSLCGYGEYLIDCYIERLRASGLKIDRDLETFDRRVERTFVFSAVHTF